MRFTAAALLSVFTFTVAISAHNLNGTHSKNETVHNDMPDDMMDETPGSGGDYVVIVDDDDPRTIPQLFKELGGDADTLKYVYNNSHFKGFAATMSKHCVGRLDTFGGIKQYEQRVVLQASVTQNEAPWGLERISKNGAVGQGNPLDLAFTYTFDESPGLGVDIYIVDTGVK